MIGRIENPKLENRIYTYSLKILMYFFVTLLPDVMWQSDYHRMTVYVMAQSMLHVFFFFLLLVCFIYLFCTYATTIIKEQANQLKKQPTKKEDDFLT